MAAYPGAPLHVTLDTLNTGKPKQDRWLARHPSVYLHFVPAYSSWLIMVGVWFSILSRQPLRDLSCTAVRQLREATDRFVNARKEITTPCEWTRAVVEPSSPKRRYSDLCKQVLRSRRILSTPFRDCYIDERVWLGFNSPRDQGPPLVHNLSNLRSGVEANSTCGHRVSGVRHTKCLEQAGMTGAAL